MSVCITFAYLASITAANLLVAQFGPPVIIFNAFVFIGLDLVARDKLHDLWAGPSLVWRMGALIVAGGVVATVLNPAALRIAYASGIAFAASAALDAIVYQLLIQRSFLARSNGSNVVGALGDSILFPTIAFGAFSPGLIAAQFVAKVLGGYLWSLAISRFGVVADEH